MVHHSRQAEENQTLGLPATDGDCTDYLGAWDRAPENVRRIDPDGVLGLMLIKMGKTKEGSKEYKELESLFDEYRKIPDANKVEEINNGFRRRLNQIVS